MQKSEEPQQDMTEAIRIAVRRAFAEVRIEEKRAEKKKTLYNTRRLMESYIDLKKYINNAITEEEEVTENAYNAFRGENAKLKSVKESKMVTAMMIINIDRALTELEAKLLRRFGITEGNRQTLLLGMFMSQLVNPYKYTIYPGFYESCGPEGEKLIEYVEKEWKHQPHVGELPLDIVAQTEAHGDKAVAPIDAIADRITGNQDEFRRLQNDMHCYRAFAYAFGWKVKAAQHVLNYKWGKDIKELDAAVPLLEKSLDYYRQLVDLTKDTYLYANSMQTAQRRIPIGGDGGNMKHWSELLPKYEQELANLKKNIAMLKAQAAGTYKMKAEDIKPLKDATQQKGAFLA